MGYLSAGPFRKAPRQDDHPYGLHCSQAAPAVLFLWLELRAGVFCLQPLMDTALGQSKGFLRLLYNLEEARRDLCSTQVIESCLVPSENRLEAYLRDPGLPCFLVLFFRGPKLRWI